MLKYNFQKLKNIVPAQAKNEHVEKTNEAKNWFLVKINKIGKKKKFTGERTQIKSNERRDIMTDATKNTKDHKRRL